MSRSAVRKFVLPSAQDFLRSGGFGSGYKQAPAGWPFPAVPNFEDWQAGDVVLLSASGFTGLLITGGQWLLDPKRAASCHWVHCAL